LFDLDGKRWAYLALELTGLDENHFSRIVSVKEQLTMKGKTAEQLGMTGTSIIVGASDGCLAQLGSNAMTDDDLTITIGTSGAVRVASSKRLIDPEARVFNYILDENDFVCGGATNNGTALIDWYSQNMDSNASANPNNFVEKIKEIPAGCDGMVMVPHLLGERAPIYDANARGAFVGISINHDQRYFQRAMIEGICFQIRWIAETVEGLAGRRGNCLVSGGFTRSEYWVQMLCDVLARPLTLHNDNDASTIGAAMLGFAALDVKSEFNSTQTKIFYPEEKTSAVYNDVYKKFRRVVAVINNVQPSNNSYL
jgi:gluconokinase